jgi:TetR/AcrR family transcriptional regulator, transcriptional repressor for nem operon
VARPRRSEHIQERLLDLGLTFFAKQGYHGTGIKEIVEAAGVPKGSFYNYFSSKEVFAEAIIRHYAAGYWREWSSYFASSPVGDPFAALRYSFEMMIAKHSECKVKIGCVVFNLAAEISESSDLCRKTMQSVIVEWRERFTKYVRMAQEQGTARSDITAEDLADIFCNAWEGSLLRMKIENSTEPLELCISIMFEKFLKQ